MLEVAVDGGFELVLPIVVLDELKRVLREKLGFGDRNLQEAVELFQQVAFATPAAPQRTPNITGDRSDDAILASAVDAAADVLVTGDRRHLLPLGEHEGVRLLTPQALLAELRAST